MTKLKTSSSKITACPECDSGNLHVSGSEVECLSCGWKHTAKKTRTTKDKNKPLPRVASIEDCGPEGLADLLPQQESIAAQLQAAVTQPTKPKAERTPRQAPTTVLSFGKSFQPRTNQLGQEDDVGRWAQNANWIVVTQYLHDHGNKATYADLVAAIQAAAEAGGYLQTCNARGFVQGRVRNGHLVAAQQ